MVHPYRIAAMMVCATLAPAWASQTDGWVEDASNAAIPAASVHGVLNGRPFRPDHVTAKPYYEESGQRGAPVFRKERVDGICLELRQGDFGGERSQVTLFLMAPRGKSVDGRTFTITPAGLWRQPDKIMDRDGKGWFSPVAGVQLNASTPGVAEWSELFPKATLRVELGRRRGGKLPGRIYLATTSSDHSWLAGSFEAAVEPR